MNQFASEFLAAERVATMRAEAAESLRARGDRGDDSSSRVAAATGWLRTMIRRTGRLHGPISDVPAR